MNYLIKRLNEKEFIVDFDKSVHEKIFSLNSEEEYGARPIKRIIQNLCEDYLSDEILKGNIKPNLHVTIQCDEKGELTME
jgi:ATP-dependent Clp protease ATP-binding subunit ClpC